MEIKILKSCEVVGVPYKKGDIVDCAPSIAEKYIKAKLAESIKEEPQPSKEVEVFPETGTIKAEGQGGN